MNASSWPRFVLTAALVLVVAGCGDDTAETTTSPPAEVTSTETPITVAPETTAAPETTSAPTTAEPTTTTAAPATTTTEAPTTTTTTTAAPSGPFTVAGDGSFPAVLGGPTDAHGSGCAPGAGSLPDGIWFVFPTAWTASSIDFDLACFYSGDAATAEAAARGEESPPPNDYIITNDNATLRSVPVAIDAIGHRLDINIALETVPFDEFVANPGEFQVCFDFCLVWLYVNNGEVTEVVSQYVP